MSAMTVSPPGSVQRTVKPAEQNTANPSQEEIANLAYTLWQQRGCPEASADEDWIEAERELRSRLAAE